MDLQSQILAEKILRTDRSIFTVHQMNRLFSDAGVRISIKETQEYLDNNPLVFPLQDRLYITRAGAFTNELFSMKPTAREWEKGVMIVGDRCLPYVDPEMLACSMDYYLEGNLIPKKQAEFDSDFAIDRFILFGEEYAPQYIASDPACKDIDLAARDFELPNKVKMTGLSLEYMHDNFGFEKGDRLLCCVHDWNNGIINMIVVHEHENQFDQGEDGEKRLHWYSQLEKYFLDCFDRIGPCGTIEEQVADVMFEHRKELCVPCCGSVEEFLERYTNRVGMEYFGVETRLWKKGETVPAVGKWNNAILKMAEKEIRRNKNPNKAPYHYSIPQYIIDQYLMDMNFRRSSCIEDTLDRMFPEECPVPADEKKSLLLHMQERNVIVTREYNWFLDQVPGPARKNALELYGRVSYLVYRIDCVGNGLMDFPQQELVILSQLYSHLLRVLQAIADGEYTDQDYEALEMSLEGMKWNFEDIEGQLEKAVKDQHTNKFKVLKK